MADGWMIDGGTGNADGRLTPAALIAANINPSTFLATDYLNHFNEIIMLLEMLPAMPECAEDILAWEPKSYQQHFRDSNFKEKALAIEAFEAVRPAVRADFDDVVAEIDARVTNVQALLAEAGETPDLDEQIAILVSTELRPLIDRASGIINNADGVDHAADHTPQPSAQDAVDELFS
ncbi:MAG TPA: hypothetical protein PLG99_03330 [Kaistiaceae bacterium]|nr:hypothetical protein [Kaistiaceae bacterium]